MNPKCQEKACRQVQGAGLPPGFKLVCHGGIQHGGDIFPRSLADVEAGGGQSEPVDTALEVFQSPWAGTSLPS